MALAFYNTLTRKKEKFIPITPGIVKLYTCGPTVYDFSHIGNARTYVFEDLLRRWLKQTGYQVTQIMNITDVDDKTIKGSQNKKIPLSQYTQSYIDYFFEDLQTLRIEKAEHYPKATEHVAEMVAIIQNLLSKGIAYRGEDQSVYYNVSKFPHYGELAHIQVDELKPGARVSHDEYDKTQASDFALWKAWDPDDGEVFWETQLGKGRPGWHIECSAMSMKYLGAHFDIHTGGVDNIFPHHQNEIAQSEAYTGKKFVNYWLHAEHLIVDGRKMSKSLENFYTVRDILKQGFSPLALRYFYLSSHYRNKLNFTFPALQGAFSSVTRIHDFLRRLADCRGSTNPKLSQVVKNTQKEFTEALHDDLNSPKAFAALHELINQLNPHLDEQSISPDQALGVANLFLDLDQVLSLGFSEFLGWKEPPSEVQALIAEREKARQAKDFRKADELRRAIHEKGFVLEDTPFGPRYKARHE